MSCPLIGDVRYGKGEHNRLFRERFDLHRLALHCSALRVAHPDAGELHIECPLAPDMAAAIAAAKAAFGSGH
jgi:tRNA pseudouridine65 synthase